MRTTADRRTQAARRTAMAAEHALPWTPAPVETRTDPVPQLPPRSARTCRALNFAVALFAVILAAPVFVAVAVLVAVSSPGPVFYRQLRVGLDRRRPGSDPYRWRRQVDYGGRLFRIWKFRTMYVDADGARGAWATPEDPRVTPVGRFLRKHRLDELPQLLNVLKGDMNIVGPRPEQPDIFLDLRTKIDAFPRRQRVLPGITGWAQINHHYGTSVEDMERKVELDLEYIERRSVAEDLRIMWRTVPVMLFRQGAW